MPERDLLRSVSARLARDQPVDWDDVERQAVTDDEREEVRHLRVVATMAVPCIAQAGGPALDFSVSPRFSIASDHGARKRVSSAAPAAEPALPGTRWGHIEIFSASDAARSGGCLKSRALGSTGSWR